MKRYPAVIMGTCVIPWTDSWAFDETMFRDQVRDLAASLTRHLYIFGTAGEGYAVTESQFERISRVFLEESASVGVTPAIGIIHLSLGSILERIERARSWGCRAFQISLPAWGALTEGETTVFFREVCGRFRDCQFLHYNLLRARRQVTAAEYARLAQEHPNLVATKNTVVDDAFITDLVAQTPDLQHFLGETGYSRMRDRFECGLLISIASTNPKRANLFFNSRGKVLTEMLPGLRAALEAIKQAVNGQGHMDGAYDKLLYKLQHPDFPLRLLPPYHYGDEGTLARYREAMQRLAPDWLPESIPIPT